MGPYRPQLAGAVKAWATPMAADARSVKTQAPGRQSLNGQARDWPTPTVKGNHNRAGLTPSSGDGLATAVHGEGAPPNPAWVELLMGLPSGWTDLGPVARGPRAGGSPNTRGSRRARLPASPADPPG